MLVIFPIFNRIQLLPYFLRYYTSVGATQFVCALYHGKRNPLYKKINRYGARYPLAIRTSTNSRLTHYNPFEEMYGLNQVRREFTEQFRWYCIADLDEFHYFGRRKMTTVARYAEEAGYAAVGGAMVDRIAANGQFPTIHGPLDRRFPLGCDLTASVGANPRKISLARSHIEIALGHHEASAKTAWGGSETHHFKWHKGVYEILKTRYKYYHRQGLPWTESELPPQIRVIEEGVNLTDPKLHLRTARKLGV
jgi:hypothetical protein